IQFDTADTDQDAVVMTIRPENIKVAEEGDDNLISGMIISREYLGQSFQYTVQTVLGNLKFEEAHHAMRD
ncbi:spermidine/putrescine ABC transporter ATP-binding protein, partial [Lactobacillus delbrueckii subsp. bulgaricus]|nr:spermidine/putrescine ABC transporter ATP-binding protein [Lactobacillus delbrueckii subsp. bulgaricus]